MQDTDEQVGQIKKIIFEDTDKRHADLKIRLHYDQLKQGEFFRLMLTGYIEKDERVMSYIEEYKGEIESIFDLLEKENPEL